MDNEGRALEIKYHANLQRAIANLFQVYLLDPPANLDSLSSRNARDWIASLAPTSAEIITYYRGHLRRDPVPIECPALPFPLHLLLKNRQLFLIKDICLVNKCEHCGNYFKTSHTCSVRRRQFYFHHIHTQSSDWWEEISFRPIGAPGGTERLFVCYDVETYTWHGAFGKQLVPFMLVFKLVGDQELVQRASTLAVTQEWMPWKDEPHTYYYLNPQKRAVGYKFKTFRSNLQTLFTTLLLEHFSSQNPQLTELWQNQGYNSIGDIPAATLQGLTLQGNPRFIEIYVVGHNINGFDEIVLAAQVLSHQADVAPIFKVTRNFMPRAGKILFNDITFALPNPISAPSKRKDYDDWHRGILQPQDCRYQYVKFMVRDTFALTHTSLRNAAAAYSLPVAKGHCPYQAVNEFYMFGTYLSDEDGFPHRKYWKNEEEYLLNRQIWESKKQNGNAYDIVQHTLEYCVMDVLVTAELVGRLQESYRNFVAEAVHLPEAGFNVFQRPTISSNSHAIFKQILYRSERVQKPSLDRVLLAPSRELYEYVRASIRGGRCYPTFIGVLQEPIYVYDICGMYASALTHPFPAGSPLNPFERAIAVRAWERKMQACKTLNYFDAELLPAIFTIDADPPDEDALDVLPPFCSRKGGRLCWTNESLRGEVATSIDVITLHNRGWRVRIVPDERTTVFPQWKCLAREYVQLNIAAKEKADREKNQTMRSIAKLLSNALYGSFATKLDNKKIVFSDQIENKLIDQLSSGNLTVKSCSFIETDDFSAEILPQFVVAYPPVIPVDPEDGNGWETNSPAPYIPTDHQNITSPAHVTKNTYTYKPITFLDAEHEDICLQTLEQTTPLITNDRYPSQIASFVLAWTRAFVSEWAGFLYEEDRGTPLEQRPLKSVYGDTDSLFVTEHGHRLMEQKGKKRIKKYGGPLVFNPEQPDLTWLVECETQCATCKADAYSSESVFLAPKLYALRDTICSNPTCGQIGKGKLRAKGHATTQLSYDLLCACYYADSQLGSERFQSSRLSLRRTLASAQSHVQPFTVTETTLTRTLRPWKDRTLHSLDQHRLVPYSNRNPNPRNTETNWMELPWTM